VTFLAAFLQDPPALASVPARLLAPPCQCQKFEMASNRAENIQIKTYGRRHLFRHRRVLSAVWRTGVAILIVAFCLSAAVPFAPSLPSDNIDSAWGFALNAAVAQGLAFGRDVIFTFGPYACLYTSSYHPDTDHIAIAAGVVLALALAAGLIALSRGTALWRPALLSALFALPPLKDPLFFTVPLIFLAVVARLATAEPSAMLPLASAASLLIVAMALLPLIKGTFAAAAAAGLGAAGVLLLRRDRRLALAAFALFLIAIAVFWCLANQKLADLPEFLAAQPEIVSGYTEAMALPGPLWQIALYIVVAAGVLAANMKPALRAGLPGAALWLVAGITLFLAFKSGFIRQDEHVFIAAGSLGLVACALAVFNPGYASAGGLVLGLFGWLALGSANTAFEPGTFVQRMRDHYRNTAIGALQRVENAEILRQEFAGAMGQIRAEHKLPAFAGSTDAYTAEQSIPLAYGLSWSPRPVLQSYSAWSPLLEELDARHLTGPASPHYVLFALRPIDNRLPALEDGLSWLPLLSRYQAIWLQDNHALLRRLDFAAPPPLLGPGAETTGRLGEEVTIPNSMATPIWAKIDVKLTFLGRVLSTLLRPPPLGIMLRLVSGKTVAYRYVAGMGKAGFVLSPLISNAGQMLAMQMPTADQSGIKVAAFTLVGSQRFWRATYRLRLSELRLPPRPETQGVTFGANIPAANEIARQPVCNTHAPSSRGACKPLPGLPRSSPASLPCGPS
jgi:hypothetical protein